MTQTVQMALEVLTVIRLATDDAIQAIKLVSEVGTENERAELPSALQVLFSGIALAAMEAEEGLKSPAG